MAEEKVQTYHMSDKKVEEKQKEASAKGMKDEEKIFKDALLRRKKEREATWEYYEKV